MAFDRGGRGGGGGRGGARGGRGEYLLVDSLTTLGSLCSNRSID